MTDHADTVRDGIVPADYPKGAAALAALDALVAERDALAASLQKIADQLDLFEDAHPLINGANNIARAALAANTTAKEPA